MLLCAPVSARMKCLYGAFVQCFGCILLGLARTIYIRCIYSTFGRGISTCTVTYGVYIRFWPTLHMIETNNAGHERVLLCALVSARMKCLYGVFVFVCVCACVCEYVCECVCVRVCECV